MKDVSFEGLGNMKIKIKVENNLFQKTANIFIKHIECSPKIIITIIDALMFENNIEVIADMGFAEDECISNEEIEQFKLKHDASFEQNKYSNGLFRLTMTPKECKEFIKDIFKFDIEYIIVYDGSESLQEQYLSYDSARFLVNQQKMNAFITVIIFEDEIVITLNKNAYDIKQLASKIKALF